MDGEHNDMIDVISQCKLRYFGCMLVKSKTFSTVVQNPNQCLQHLSITSYGSRITDVFMDSVSAHGGLESVFVSVFSLTVDGITAVIRNSPKLYIFDVYTELIFSVENNKADLKVFKDTLKVKFLHRKLISLY